MFSITQVCRDQLEAILNRNYKRCNKLIVNPDSGFICNSCASKRVCACCSKEPEGHQGKLCSSCKIKKNLCAKCGESLSGGKQAAMLCANCGLGSSGNNCCKMKY